jgi:Cu(I)/Ag(I) efflux system periplasmic protein CusF
MKFHHLVGATALLVAVGAHAQSTAASSADRATQQSPIAAAAQSDGEVRKIDKEQGKLTLKHGPLKNFDMPAMTMVFRVVDTKMLDGLKEGDKVKFNAEKVNGAFTVTAIQPIK